MNNEQELVNKQQNIKSLSQIEAEQKQKFIFKPRSDRFFQPLAFLLFAFGFVLLAVGLIMSAYSFQSFQIINNTKLAYPMNIIAPDGMIRMTYLNVAAALLITCACLFALAFIIRLFRAFKFVTLNQMVKLRDVDSYLVLKFTIKFFLYIFGLFGIVTIALIAACELWYHANLFSSWSFYKMTVRYWYPAAILSILTASTFVLYVFANVIKYILRLIKDCRIRPEDQEIASMKNRSKERSYIKILLLNIMFALVFVSMMMFCIALFIYGIYGVQNYNIYLTNLNLGTTNSQFSLTDSFSQISVVFYITGSLMCLATVVSCYCSILDYKIANYDEIKESKIIKERERIERLNVKKVKKELRNVK